MNFFTMLKCKLNRFNRVSCQNCYICFSILANGWRPFSLLCHILTLL